MGALSEEEIDGTPWSLEPLVGVLAVRRHIAPLPGGVASWLTDQRHMGVEPLLHFPLFTIFTQQLPSRGHKRGILSNAESQLFIGPGGQIHIDRSCFFGRGGAKTV